MNESFFKSCDKIFDTHVRWQQSALRSPSYFDIFMDFVVIYAQAEIKKKYSNWGFSLNICFFRISHSK